MTPLVSVLVAMLTASAAGGRAQSARDADGDIRPAGLPSRILRDFAALGAPGPLRTLGAGGILAAAAHPADQATVRSLSSSAAAETALDGGATLGGSAVQFGVAGAVYGVGLIAHNDTAAGAGTALLEAQVVGGALTQGLKYAVDRTRPDGGHHSFPSGHTESAFATADVLLQRFGWKAGIAAYAGAAYVGSARIAERQHYLSDVVFGAAVGIASARAVEHRSRNRSRRIAPVLTRNRAGAYAGLEILW